MSDITTENTGGTEGWRELAKEVRTALLDYWTHEHERKSELRMLRVVRVLDRIRDLDQREGGR